MSQREDRKDSTVFKTCPDKINVPSEQELMILSRMRDLKAKVKELKEKLAFLTTASCGDETSGRTQNIELELDRLRAKWKTLEKEREQAAQARMVALGHEQP
jgi:predicted nuclease with TOPRIM domain